MMKPDFEKTGWQYKPTAIIGKESAQGFGAYKESCSISYQKKLTDYIDAMMEGMVTMMTLLVAGAVILGSVMLYNLGVLSYLERYREFPTLKVLGFASKKIKNIISIW